MASRGSTSSSNGLLPGTTTTTATTQPDLEAGKEGRPDLEEEEDAASSAGPFDIANTKNAPPETLKRWRVKLFLPFYSFFLFVMWYDVVW